jgi:DNA polymerase II small subunit
MKEELLSVIRERGLLLEKGVLDLLEAFTDVGFAKEFLINIERVSGQKMISLKLLNNNVEFVNSVVKELPGEEKKILERTFVKFGLSLEVRKEKEILEEGEDVKGEILKKEELNYKVFYADTKPDKKLEVRDFTNHFRARYMSLQRILMNRAELQGSLVSINKISSDRQSLSIIGIVTEKRITKNKNLIIKFEDLTGDISGIVKLDMESDGESLFNKATEVQMDEIVGVRASGNRDLLFVHDILFPDCFLHEKTRFDEEVNVAFVSDVHCGSDRHLKKSFEKFLEWLNSDEAKKIKYLFFVGDNVDGVGVFPGQENVLKLKSMEEQYGLLASYLKKIPNRITMFMCPGQHDATRVAEPQPLISRKYAPELYEVENLVLVTNPCMVKLLENGKEFKILMYHGASMHSFVNEIKELREMDVYKCPAKIVKHMLKRRHLAPMHGDVVYIPNSEKDPLVIEEAPDVLCTGEVHHLDVDSYNGVKIITGSCWQAITDFEVKVGHVPDPCKVPVLNLKSGDMKVYDFSDKGEVGKWM